MTTLTQNRSLLNLLLVCLFSIASVSASYAKAPVWKVSKGSKTLFIGGTIHLLAEQDYPLPSAFNTAFAASQEVFFETDVETASSISAQAKFMPVIMRQDGKTLSSQLKPDTSKSLTDYLASRNYPASMFDSFTPAGVYLTLTVLEIQRLGASSEHGVEAYFNAKAKNTKKEVGWLESIDQQINFIEKLNQVDADELISSFLKQTDSLEDTWNKLLSTWRSGDMDAFEELAIVKMVEESPELYQFLLVERNNAWIPDIEAMLDTPEVEFVLVGAAHLAGKDSVLKKLVSAGYDVTQLD